MTFWRWLFLLFGMFLLCASAWAGTHHHGCAAVVYLPLGALFTWLGILPFLQEPA